MKQNLLFLSLISFLLLFSCDKSQEEQVAPTLNPPAQEDAEFTYIVNENQVTFTASNPALVNDWNLGNGDFATGFTVTTTYQDSGYYDVTLYASNDDGVVSNTQSIYIESEEVTDTVLGTYSGLINWTILKKDFFGNVVQDETVPEFISLEISSDGTNYFVEGHPFDGIGDLGPIGQGTYDFGLWGGAPLASPFFNVNYSLGTNCLACPAIWVDGSRNNFDDGGYTWWLSVSGFLSQ